MGAAPTLTTRVGPGRKRGREKGREELLPLSADRRKGKVGKNHQGPCRAGGMQEGEGVEGGEPDLQSEPLGRGKKDGGRSSLISKKGERGALFIR